jgi:hypothetical protein
MYIYKKPISKTELKQYLAIEDLTKQTKPGQ